MTDLTARITEMLRALPSPIGAEPFTENDDGAPMWLSCLPWELLLCKVAKIAAAAAEEHYRPLVDAVEQLNELPDFAVLKDSTGTIWEKEHHADQGPWWRTSGPVEGEDEAAVRLPAVVLYNPEGGSPND